MRHVTGFLFVLSACTMIFFSPALACEKPLRVGWNYWPPYQYVENNEIIGIDIKVVRYVAKELGCPLNLIQMPWKKVIEGIKSGNIDMASGASVTKERHAFGYFSRPYRREEVSLFIQKQNSQKFLKIKSLTDTLSYNIRIGINESNYYGQEFEFLKNNERFQKSLVTFSKGMTFREFSTHKIDAILADKYSGLHRIRLNGLSNKVKKLDGFSIYTGPVHLLVSKKTIPVEKIQNINQAITQYLLQR